MVWKAKDPLTGAGRDDLFMAEADARALGLVAGDRVAVRSDSGEVEAHVRISEIRPGNVQMFFPEANPLISAGRRDPVALVPDYNATVSISKLDLSAAPSRPPRPSRRPRDRGRPRPSRRPPPESPAAPEPRSRRSSRRPSPARPRPPGRRAVTLVARTLAPRHASRLPSPVDRPRRRSIVALRQRQDGALQDGVPLLHRAILALASVCTEVIVVASPDGSERSAPHNAAVPLHVALDPRPFAGPLVGAAAGVEEAAKESLVVVVGGDMPGLVPAVIRQMLRRMLAQPTRSAGATGRGMPRELPSSPSGKVRPLPLVLDRTAALPAAEDLIGEGTARLLALVQALDIAVIPEAEWRRSIRKATPCGTSTSRPIWPDRRPSA